MSEGINFYGIAEEPPTARRRLPDRPRAGYEVERRPGRRLFPSEYHLLLERERRTPWAVTVSLTAAAVLLVLAFYVAR